MGVYSCGFTMARAKTGDRFCLMSDHDLIYGGNDERSNSKVFARVPVDVVSV